MTDVNYSQQRRSSGGELLCPTDSREDEIDLMEMLSIAWGGRWIIVSLAFLFAAAAAIISLAMPNIYKSEVLLAPAADGEQAALAGRIAGQLGGLAGLAGIDLGGGGVNKSMLALEVLKSRELITRFINDHDLAVPLMAAEGWDLDAGEWIIDSDIYDVERRKWVRKVDPPQKAEPSSLEMYEKFREILSVNEDAKTGLVRVSILLMSPRAAQKWVSMLVKDLNDFMRRNDIDDAEKSIRYLESQLSKTSVAEMQNIFYQLIEQQTKTVMLAEVRDEYVFKTIDPAVVPERKSQPKRALICILATILGGFIGVLIVFILRAAENRRLRTVR